MPVDENGRPYHPLFSPNQPQGNNSLGALGTGGAAIGGAIGGTLGKLGGLFSPRGSNQPGVDSFGLSGASGQAGRFANVGESGFSRLGGEANQLRGRLERQALGQDSLSREQLRQGLQQQLASYSSMAAGAAPQNQAMSARTAMMGMGRAQSGLSGQAALAGIQERQAANQALGNLLMQERQQDLTAALGARGHQIQGLGTLEQAASSRYGADLQTPTQGERILGAAGGGLSLFGIGR